MILVHHSVFNVGIISIIVSLPGLCIIHGHVRRTIAKSELHVNVSNNYRLFIWYITLKASIKAPLHRYYNSLCCRHFGNHLNSLLEVCSPSSQTGGAL